MKLFANWHRMLTLFIVSTLFVSVMAAQSPYDKFRNKEYSNKGYMSEQDEMKMGEQVHQELLKQIRLVENSPVNDYVNRLGQSLASRSERRNIPWRFYVVNDKTINAFATLGGRVYVHTGLIAATTSEAQLASVIGHEIGHIVGRHGLENVKRAGSMKTQGTVIGATILGAILGGQQGAEAGMALGSMVAGGFLMKHSREAEREADFLGLYNLKNANYNTGGMIEMFQMLQQVSKGGGGSLGSILASHPDPREREAVRGLRIEGRALEEDRHRSERRQIRHRHRRQEAAGRDGPGPRDERRKRLGPVDQEEELVADPEDPDLAREIDRHVARPRSDFGRDESRVAHQRTVGGSEAEVEPLVRGDQLRGVGGRRAVNRGFEEEIAVVAVVLGDRPGGAHQGGQRSDQRERSAKLHGVPSVLPRQSSRADDRTRRASLLRSRMESLRRDSSRSEGMTKNHYRMPRGGGSGTRFRF